MERTYVQFYAEQDEKQTMIMAAVPGDKPVCLFAYDRALVNGAEAVSALELRHDGGTIPSGYIGVLYTIKGDVQQR